MPDDERARAAAPECGEPSTCGPGSAPAPSLAAGAADSPDPSPETCPSACVADLPAYPRVESRTSSDAGEAACAPRRHLRVVAAVCLLLLLVALAACWMLWQGGHPPEVPNVVVRPSSPSAAPEDDDQQKIAEGMIGFSINTRIVLCAADAPGDFAFGNPAGNGKRIKLTLVRDDTGTVLAETGLLDPGTHLGPERLDEQLEPGEYACTAYVDGYRDDGSLIGRVAAGVVVVVQEGSPPDRD